MIINPKNYKSVICLDGDLPFPLIKTFDLPIIAADGAANKLLANQIVPSVVIGDLDSINNEVRNQCECIKAENQDYTDFEKAVFYMQEKNLSPAIITGINGGYLDRILMNVNIFSQTESVFCSENMIGFVITGHKEICAPIFSKISIFGINNAVVSTTGLKWNLNKTTLSFGNFCSCSNRNTDDTISIDVADGKALLFIYLNRED